MLHQATAALRAGGLNRDLQATDMLYNNALVRGRRGQLWSGLSGRSRQLFSLEEVSQACSVQARSSGGTRTVAIALICGSEGRAGDFDRDFNPLQDHTRDRWLGIASALQQGRTLPPVALIQVGDRYFVRDGHHRISVARALGRKAIEATVEVWRADEPLLWKQPSQAPNRRQARNHEELRTLASGLRPASILGWLQSALCLRIGQVGREVEEVIASHPAVAEVGVAGIPDRLRGEAVKAWVVLREGQQVTGAEIRACCREKLVAYKAPRQAKFRDSLPRTLVGKVLRREPAREPIQRRRSLSRGQPQGEEERASLSGVLSPVLGPSPG